MLELKRSTKRWWQKPLARIGGRDLPAELVVLQAVIQPGEAGAWLNSRGTTTGATDLILDTGGRLKTVRMSLPPFVVERLRSIYDAFQLTKGTPDLVLWNATTQMVRFVEVKCPDWDRASSEQLRFHKVARDAGCQVDIVEWRFTAG